MSELNNKDALLEHLQQEKQAIRKQYRDMEITTEEYQAKMEDIYERINKAKNTRPGTASEGKEFWA